MVGFHTESLSLDMYIAIRYIGIAAPYSNNYLYTLSVCWPAMFLWYHMHFLINIASSYYH